MLYKTANLSNFSAKYGTSYGIYGFLKTEEKQQFIYLFEKYEVDFTLRGHYYCFVDMKTKLSIILHREVFHIVF